ACGATARRHAALPAASVRTATIRRRARAAAGRRRARSAAHGGDAPAPAGRGCARAPRGSRPARSPVRRAHRATAGRRRSAAVRAATIRWSTTHSTRIERRASRSVPIGRGLGTPRTAARENERADEQAHGRGCPEPKNRARLLLRVHDQRLIVSHHPHAEQYHVARAPPTIRVTAYF